MRSRAGAFLQHGAPLSQLPVEWLSCQMGTTHLLPGDFNLAIYDQLLKAV